MGFIVEKINIKMTHNTNNIIYLNILRNHDSEIIN